MVRKVRGEHPPPRRRVGDPRLQVSVTVSSYRWTIGSSSSI